MQQHTRSEQARLNGSKSKGAITPEGQQKAKTANLKHGLYATEETLAWTIDQEKYDAHRKEIFDIWQPVNRYVAKRLEVLVKVLWRLDCLTAYGWDHATEMMNTQAANLEHMYQLSLEKGSLSDRIDTKIRQFNREIRTLEREIDQLQRKFKHEGPSQNALKTKESPQTSPGLSAKALATADAVTPEKPQAPETAEKTPVMPPPTANFSNEETPETAPRS